MNIRITGFTLLEVLIALAIFAISALVVLEQASLSISQQARLEEKTLALWVAENQLAAMRLEPEWPAAGSTEKKTTNANRNWQIQQAVEATANPLLRKITVAVSAENAREPSLTLTGYRGEH